MEVFSNKVFQMTDDDITESKISQLFFSGFASSSAIMITHPLDIIRLNLLVKPLSVWEALNYHHFNYKGFAGIYRGMFASMGRAMFYANFRFELYELARRHSLLNTFYDKVFVASICGVIAGAAVNPITKVYVRSQNDDLLPPNERRYYKGLVHGIYCIKRDEGFRQLYAGAFSSALRGMMGTIGQLAFYDETKELLIRSQLDFEDNFYTYFVSSIIAGCATSILQQPFEVVSINLLYAPAGKFKRTSDVIIEIYRRYGLKGFFKGTLTSLVRIIPHTVVTYMILEDLRLRFGMIMRTRRTGDVVEIISISD